MPHPLSLNPRPNNSIPPFILFYMYTRIISHIVCYDCVLYHGRYNSDDVILLIVVISSRHQREFPPRHRCLFMY